MSKNRIFSGKVVNPGTTEADRMQKFWESYLTPERIAQQEEQREHLSDSQTPQLLHPTCLILQSRSTHLLFLVVLLRFLFLRKDTS